MMGAKGLGAGLGVSCRVRSFAVRVLYVCNWEHKAIENDHVLYRSFAQINHLVSTTTRSDAPTSIMSLVSGYAS